MPAREQAGDDPADHLPVADDDAADLGLDAVVALAERRDAAFDVRGGLGQCGIRGHGSLSPSGASALAVSRIMRK